MLKLVLSAFFLSMVYMQCTAQEAPIERVLHSFHGLSDGSGPSSSLVEGSDGTLYGTTQYDGPSNRGTVFKLVPPAEGQKGFTQVLLHAFTGDDGDGAYPRSNLILDSTGALYGTTQAGGGSGVGTVFKLTPPQFGQGAWTETVLFSFDTSDGAGPAAGLIADDHGVLYGTTLAGGSAGFGTVFQLSPPVSGSKSWSQEVLHSFAGGEDGCSLYAGLVRGGNGILYGVTTSCGINNSGTVFELTPPTLQTEKWIEHQIHSFSGPDGSNPFGTLIMDSIGRLYGTTQVGGAYEVGTAFILTSPASIASAWSETVIFSFGASMGGLQGPSYPEAGLLLDKDGALFGTTLFGLNGGGGSIYKLIPPDRGGTSWNQIAEFTFDGLNGATPTGSLIKSQSNNVLLGTTSGGGRFNLGEVFAIKE